MSSYDTYRPQDPGATPRVLALLKRSFWAPFGNLLMFVTHAALPVLLLYLHGSRTIDFGQIELPDVLKRIPNMEVVMVEFLAFGLFLAGWYRVRNGFDPARFGPFGVLLSLKTLVFLLAFACIFLAHHVLNGGIRLILFDLFPVQAVAPDSGVLPGPLFSSLAGYGAVFVLMFVVSSSIARAAEGQATWFTYLNETIAGRVQFIAAIGLSIFVIDFFFVGFGVNAVTRIVPDGPIRYDVLLMAVARFYFLAVAAAALSEIAFMEDEEDEEGEEGASA